MTGDYRLRGLFDLNRPLNMCFAAGFRRVSYVFETEISKDVAVGRRHSQYLYSPNYSVNEFKTAALTDSVIVDER